MFGDNRALDVGSLVGAWTGLTWNGSWRLEGGVKTYRMTYRDGYWEVWDL